MISRQEADAVAAAWARQESARRGGGFRAVVDEFDLGYVVRTLPLDTSTPAVPGDSPATVIDRETGELSHWPGLPAPIVQDQYRHHRATRPSRVLTADPAVELRRSMRRPATPSTVAQLTTVADVFVARGAKGDQELLFHPLMADLLRRVPAGQLTRGAERHAELIVVSDALHEFDRRRHAEGLPSLTLEQARAAFARAELDMVRVREPGDPFAGPCGPPCASCIRVSVHFGVFGPEALGFAQEFSWQGAGLSPLYAESPVASDRFPPGVADVLLTSGWRPTWANEPRGLALAEQLAARGYVAFPAAQQALAAFPGLASGRKGPGESVWIQAFSIGPEPMAHTIATLADLGRVIGSRLFPLGGEEGDSIVAIDEAARVFVLDQAGEWFLGQGIEEALATLILGRAAPRLHDDGTW
jgi:hypothetical protein